MSRFLLSVVVMFQVLLPIAKADPPSAPMSSEQIAQDARILKRALTVLHPGLTKYQTPEQWQARLDEFDQRAKAATNVRAFYLAVSRLAADVRCGHTWTNVLNQQGVIKDELLEAKNKLPFQLALVERRFLVIASADDRVQVGDEVLMINGQTPEQVIAALWPYLRADGHSDNKRYRQIGHDRFDYSQLDITWPLLNPPARGRWAVRLKRGDAIKDVSVPAMTLETRADELVARGITTPSEAWRFRIEDDLAILTIPTFSFWNSAFDWSGFLDRTMTELGAAEVKALVIDLRGNEGGDGAIAANIVQRLVDQPVRIRSEQSVTTYERVPYVLARYLDTWDFDFFDRTGQVRPITEGPQAGNLEFLPRAFGAQSFGPVEPGYRGKTFVLIDGENSSAGFQFAQLIQQAGAATLVGESTGGNRRGLSGSQLTWVTLPNSGVAVDIPLLATRYDADTPDAPVHPDIEVTPTFAARRAGIDEAMDRVRELIR